VPPGSAPAREPSPGRLLEVPRAAVVGFATGTPVVLGDTVDESPGPLRRAVKAVPVAVALALCGLMLWGLEPSTPSALPAPQAMPPASMPTAIVSSPEAAPAAVPEVKTPSVEAHARAMTPPEPCPPSAVEHAAPRMATARVSSLGLAPYRRSAPEPTPLVAPVVEARTAGPTEVASAVRVDGRFIRTVL
jgi:hypothetical protein